MDRLTLPGLTRDMTEKPILVLGGTGKIGRRVAARLRAAGHSVRVASRSGEVRFDWTDESTWDTALDGVGPVFVALPEEGGDAAPFVAHAAGRGVTRFVALSGRGVEEIGEPSMLGLERAVRESGVDWTIVRAGWFHQNFDEGMLAEGVRNGVLEVPVGDGLEPFVDAEDIAEVLATVLTTEGHVGRTYELSGPRALSFAEVAEILSGATGRRIEFRDVPAEKYAAGLVAEGVPDDVAKMLAEVFAFIRYGHSEPLVDGVQRVLGRAPRSFEDYAGAVTW
ncbi:uncharacterized protein YbjT (DUF2867 family) [Amycolatopsis cihanbeyliensis]|uniref:Uncharacterized protein YbjT (DUF2867 family) n=2 Tax=Amycolatopsis cihanbeyliensis TaxID=1128664 RepID=A0A542DDA4_AMYCI|nr:uncharacterized protein YbjT (DUF2867 family) [Amycolatopsis cihanbeyliensis]